jgi:hypothetical protein
LIASEISREASALAIKWPKAFQTAQQAGMRHIGEGEAHFEFLLAR